MKFKNYFILLLVATMAIGCKDGVKNEENAAAAEAAVADTFKVFVKLTVQKDDDFCLLYTEDGSIDFKEGIWQAVKGSPNEQTVQFNLPADVVPTQLRLDLGMNKEQSDIVLKSVTIENSGKTKVFEGDQLGYYFRPDTTKCTYDPATGIITALVKDGVRQNPSLFPHEVNLQAEIVKLVK